MDRDSLASAHSKGTSSELKSHDPPSLFFFNISSHKKAILWRTAFAISLTLYLFHKLGGVFDRYVLVIEVQDLFGTVAGFRTVVGAPLAHADAVAPAVADDVEHTVRRP